MSKSFIPWPVGVTKTGEGLIVTGDLVKAVREERPGVVAFGWGVSLPEVNSWRESICKGTGEFWTADRIALLGIMPDSVVAKTIGVTVHIVIKKRISMNIPKCATQRARRIFTAKEDALLGKASDKEIAEATGRYASAIWTRRKRLGIVNPKSTYNWTPEQIALLGTASDDVIAEQTGRSLSSVANKRCRLKIVKFVEKKTEFQWTPDKVALLGTMPDTCVAKKINKSCDFIRDYRLSLGIPVYRTWTSEQISLLGTETDSCIGKQIGKSQQAVTEKRLSLGIPSFQSRNRTKT